MRRFTRLSTVLFVLLLARGVAAEEGFKPIFDGRTLRGWEGDAKLWRVEDGAITGQTTAENPAKNNTFLIWRGGRPADFELKLEFRMPNAGFANSGVQYRSREEPKKVGGWVVGGYQADMDSDNQYTGFLYDERGRGILASRGQKQSSARIIARSWSSSSPIPTNWPKRSRTASGTSTTSSPAEITSFRRSTAG